MSSLFCLLQVARQLQPSIVYIGDAERTFVKKVPKTDKVTFNSFFTFHDLCCYMQIVNKKSNIHDGREKSKRSKGEVSMTEDA